MTLEPQADRCPRCGEAFHCGAGDPSPCPCATVTLSAARLVALRRTYTGCLCLRCLAELSEPAPPGSVQHE